MTKINLPFEDRSVWDYLRWNSYLSERYRFLYVATPKVACTSLKWWFADLEGYSKCLSEVKDSNESDPDLVIHDSFHRVAPTVTGLAPEDLVEPIVSDSYFRFAVVRNPYKRIFSAWQSKLLLREPLQVKAYLKCEFYLMPIKSALDIALAFEGFLEYLASCETPNYLDFHWTPQATLLRPDLIAYTKLTHIENAKELSLALAEHLGPNIPDPFATHRTNESLIPFLPKFITERSVELIKSLYAEDFITFEYDSKIPMAREEFTSSQLDVTLRAISLIRGRHQRLAETRGIFSAQINRALSEQSSRLNFVILEKDKAISTQKNEIKRIEVVVEQKDQAIVTQSEEIGRLNSVLLEKDKAISIQNDEIKRMRIDILEKDKTISIQTNAIKHLSQEIEKLRLSKFLRICQLVNAGRYKLSELIHLGLKKDKAYPVAFESKVNTKGFNAYQICTPKIVSNNRARVVHIIANFMTGGSSRLVVDLIEYLGGQYDQSVVTSFIPDPPAYIGLDITEFRHLENIQPLIEYFKRVKPAFIHVHYWGDCDEPWYAKAVQAADMLGIPVLENVNTPIAPYVSSAIRKYIYVSNYVREIYGQPQSDHLTIYPGSDFSLFNRPDNESCPGDCIGMVYRLEHDKLNIDSINPFIRAVQKRPSTKALIVGGGSLLEPFKKAVKNAGVADRFEFTGYVSYTELPKLYRRMSLFVVPVWKESFGQVSVFAMNMRIPVVGYNVGAIGEIIDNELLLAPAGDVEKLSDIIVRLLDIPDELAAIGQFQQKRAKDYFSVQAMIKAYEKLYAEMT